MVVNIFLYWQTNIYPQFACCFQITWIKLVCCLVIVFSPRQVEVEQRDFFQPLCFFPFATLLNYIQIHFSSILSINMDSSPNATAKQKPPVKTCRVQHEHIRENIESPQIIWWWHITLVKHHQLHLSLFILLCFLLLVPVLSSYLFLLHPLSALCFPTNWSGYLIWHHSKDNNNIKKRKRNVQATAQVKPVKIQKQRVQVVLYRADTQWREDKEDKRLFEHLPHWILQSWDKTQHIQYNNIGKTHTVF